jgi:F0F1-type ATP synthase membrane subunit b/b'
MNIYLAIFLLFDVFVMGVFASTALRHGLAHFRPHEHDLEKSHAPAPNGHLPASLREKLLAEAEANFRAVVNNAAKDLQKDLDATAEDIKKQVGKLGDEAENTEMEHYKATVVQLQDKTKDDLASIDKELAAQKAELKAKFAEDMAAEKQRLLAQIDTKLGDAVGSFLLETLQHNVDLGAQTAYLMAMLEQHKADFAREVADEAKV